MGDQDLAHPAPLNPQPLEQKQATARHVAPPCIGEGEIDQFTLLAALAIRIVYAPGNFGDARC